MVIWPGEELCMTGALGLEELLDFGITLVKSVSLLSGGEAVYFLSCFLENVSQLLLLVLGICFLD